MSAWQVSSFDRVVALASAHGIDAAGAAERFTDVLGDFDERLRPLDWAERLVKTYIAFGLLIDFGMALSDSLAEPLRSGLIDELSQDPIVPTPSPRWRALSPLTRSWPRVWACGEGALSGRRSEPSRGCSPSSPSCSEPPPPRSFTRSCPRGLCRE